MNGEERWAILNALRLRFPQRKFRKIRREPTGDRADIALLGAGGHRHRHQPRLYPFRKALRARIQVRHDEETGEELLLIVDAGGTVEDVFVNHKYGRISADMHVHARAQVEK
ncbi:MAG: 3H domain-containing protein [Candidatus Borkfalkia sp.]